MSNSAVRQYFETRLQAWAADQTSPVAISYEDVPFIPPSTGSYVECFLIPAKTLDCTVDGTRQRYMGVFQVNICTRSGLGSRTSEKLADSLIRYFPVVPKGSVSVESTPYCEKTEQWEAGWKITPVCIYYRLEV